MIEAIWFNLMKLSPWLLAGTAVAAMLHMWLPTGFARRRFTGALGVLRAVGFGVPLPLCSCGVVPAGIGLKQEGASKGAAIGFLISTPQTGVDSILVSASFLGWPFALLKVAAAGFTGVAGGLLVETADESVQPVDGFGETAEPDCCATTTNNLRQAITYGLDLIRSIWGWLVGGILISSLISVFLPPASMTWVNDSGILLASLLALVISLPLYVCATASVPIAAALVGSGFPTGAALVFLMAGPATNVATMGAIYRHFGWRALAIYLGTIVVGSISFAVAFDAVIQPSTASAVSGHHHFHGSWWEASLAGVLLVLLAYFAWDDLWKWITVSRGPSSPREENACQRCEG